MLRASLIAAAFVGTPLAAASSTDERITTRAEFVDRVANRNLSRLGVGVRVTPGGQIEGSAFGTPVTGSWDWRGNRFCREMKWGDRSWEDSCQAVVIRENRVYFQPSSGSSVYLYMR